VSSIQQNRYDQLLRRVADLKGGGSKVSDVITELFPMIDVENVPDELLALSGTRLCAEGTLAGGGVGLISKVQLFNPVDSGTLVTVEAIFVSAGTTDQFNMTTTSTAFATQPDIGIYRDTRFGTARHPTAKLQVLIDAATVTAVILWRALPNTNFNISSRKGVAVLSPGTGLLIGPTATNLGLRCTFFWRERIALPSELNF